VANERVHPLRGAGASKRGKGFAWALRKIRKVSAKKARRRLPIEEE
jgi:hypothetical protein